jgi:hypothetical protein
MSKEQSAGYRCGGHAWIPLPEKTVGDMCGGLADKRLLVTPPKPSVEAKPAETKNAKDKPVKK